MINCAVRSGPPRGRAGGRKPGSTTTCSRCTGAHACARSFTQSTVSSLRLPRGRTGVGRRLALAAASRRSPATPGRARVFARRSPHWNPTGASRGANGPTLGFVWTAVLEDGQGQSVTEWGWSHLPRSRNQRRQSRCHHVLHLLPRLSLSWVSQTCHLPWPVILPTALSSCLPTRSLSHFSP